MKGANNYMAGKLFTEEQKNILNKNPNVEAVESTRIIYTEAFKEYYVRNYLAGKKPTEIFIEAGFDPGILGNKRIERASSRWRKLYADGALVIAEDTAKNKVEEKEDINMQSEPAKKRRGRPRKNVETIVEKEVIVEEPKKKRGRPRKAVEVVVAEKTEKEVKATKTTAKNKTKKNEEKTPKKRVNKIALMAQNIKLTETPIKKVTVKSAKAEKEEIVQEPVKQETKRRGRPPKIAKELPVEAKETPMQIEPKAQVQEAEQVAPKRRGRPRKVVSVENIEKEEQKIQVKANVAVNEQVAPTKEIIEEQQPIVKEEQVNPVADLVKAINRLTGEVNSLKRLLAGKKKINY